MPALVHKAELCANAQVLATRGKGLLAADESVGTLGLRLSSVGLENSAANRCALRELLFTTPGVECALSGAVRLAHWRGALCTCDAVTRRSCSRRRWLSAAQTAVPCPRSWRRTVCCLA
jgi:hypothetical protein